MRLPEKRTALHCFRNFFDGELRFLLGNSSWTLISQTTNTVVGFAKAALLARALGPADFGVFSLVFVFIGTIQQFFDLNLGQPFIKFANDYADKKYSEKLKALVKIGWIVACVSAGAFILVAGCILISWLYFSTEGHSVRGIWPSLVLVLFSVAIDLLCSFGNGILKYRFLFRSASLIDMSGALIEMSAIVAALAVWGADLGSLICVISIASLIKSALVMLTLFKCARDLALAGSSANIAVLRNDARPLASFTISNSLSRSLKAAYSSGDVIILSAFVSIVDVGYYTAAKKLGLAIVLITQPLLSPIYAQLAQLISNYRYSAAASLVKKVSFICLMAIIPFLIPAICFRAEIIVLVFGPRFYDAGSVFLLILLTGIVRAVFFWTNGLLLALGKANERLLYDALALTLAVLLGWLGALYGGTSGFAVGLLVNQVLRETIVIFRMQLFINRKSREQHLQTRTAPNVAPESVS